MNIIIYFSISKNILLPMDLNNRTETTAHHLHHHHKEKKNQISNIYSFL